MYAADSYFDKKLAQKSQQNQLRKLQDHSMGIDFSSNDYLGLAKEAFPTTTQGSTGSRLLSGNTKTIEKLEYDLSKFYRASSALLFSSGFQANIGLLSALGERSDTYLIDSEIHASMKLGTRLSKATCWKFGHNDIVDLEQKLQKAKGNLWVFIEALYSMSGDLAPLRKLVALCKKYKAQLIVDEAHSNGIYGALGNGLIVQNGLEEEGIIRVMTFGKAFGAEGAVVLGSESLKKFLVNFCYPFIYSTAPSLGFTNTLHEQLKAVKKASSQRESLFNNIKLFQQLAQNSSLTWSKSNSAIQALILGDVTQTKHIADQLKAKGFSVFPILSPTVPLGKEQIRLCLHSYNSTEEIHALFQTLNSLL